MCLLLIIIGEGENFLYTLTPMGETTWSVNLPIEMELGRYMETQIEQS